MTGQMTFGYLYDCRNAPPWRQPWPELYAETLDLIAWTEAMGFDGAWVPEHHATQDGYMPSPLVMLGAIAARTSSIRLGTGIALAPLYHPVRFAEDCAVLDNLAGGRLEIAVAIGYRRRETLAYGVDFTRRGRRFDEFLQIVRRLWAGETVTFAGEHFTVQDAAIQPRPSRGHIPLYIGGFADKALERIARYGDGYFGNEEVCGQYAAKLRAEGKDPADARIRIQGLFLAVARDPAQAMEELAPHFHYVNNIYGEWAAEDQALGVGARTLKPMTLEAFKASGILRIMTPAEAIDYFQAMRARVPVEHVMLMRPPGLPADRFKAYARLFAAEVLPAFR